MTAVVMHGETAADVAAARGCSHEAVGQTLERGLAKLRAAAGG